MRSSMARSLPSVTASHTHGSTRRPMFCKCIGVLVPREKRRKLSQSSTLRHTFIGNNWPRSIRPLSPARPCWETLLLQQLCAMPLKKGNQLLGLLVFKTELLMIGKHQINPSFAEITPRFCPSYIPHVNTTFAYGEECGFHHRCRPFLHLMRFHGDCCILHPLPVYHPPTKTSPPPPSHGASGLCGGGSTIN